VSAEDDSGIRRALRDYVESRDSRTYDRNAQDAAAYALYRAIDSWHERQTRRGAT
jgi:hypothetical protein